MAWARALALIAVFVGGLALSAQARVFDPDVHVLANGLKVVVVRAGLSDAVAHMLWYRVGAADDPADKTGLAHYLEHMMFKGTTRLDEGAFSSLIAGWGGRDNAFTMQDATAYHVTVARRHLASVMVLEAERMHDLALDPEAARIEREVVLAERLERVDNAPQGLFWEEMRAALFGAHPYGRPILGHRVHIESFTPEDARAYYARFYDPACAILVVSGPVDTAEVLALAAASYGRVPTRRPRCGERLPDVSAPEERRVERTDPRVRHAFFTRQTLLPREYFGQKTEAWDVLAELLTGRDVGLLHRELVMRRREASGVSASFDAIARGPRVFSIGATPVAGVDVATLEESLDDALHAMAGRGFSAQEVDSAKRRLTDSAIFARDGLMAPAHALGRVLAAGLDVDAVEGWPARIDAVSPRAVTDALRAVLDDARTVRGRLLPERAEAAP